MKKLLTTAAAVTILATTANADFLRVEGALGAWNSSPTGTISYPPNSFDIADNAGLESSTNAYVWIYLKHPVPIVPNVRIEYVNPTFDGTVAELNWDGDTYASVGNTLTMTQYDAVLYYNVLDNTLWTTIDLGLDVKYIDGNYAVSADAANASPSVNADFSITMPLAYLRGRVQIPVTNIGIEAIVRGISYSDNTVVDAEIKVDYTMDFIPVVQPGLELGYRYQQVKLDGGSIGLDANFDTTFSGVYAGVMVRF